MSMQDPFEPDPREEKLPRWAQDTITALRRRTRDALVAAELVRTGIDPETSRVVIEHYDPTDPLPPFGLGASEVTFRTGELDGGRHGGIRVSAERDGSGISIMGDSSLVIRPWVTNVVKISMDPS
jgi:hypothetical protein